MCSERERSIWSASYGTRAVLEYMRQFPRTVRRVVIDGVAPADMVLPASFSTDNQTALDGLLVVCGRCPMQRAPSTARALARPARQSAACVPLTNPLTGQSKRCCLRATRCSAWCARRCTCPRWRPRCRRPSPTQQAGVFDALTALASALSGPGAVLYTGTHFSRLLRRHAAHGRRRHAAGENFGRHSRTSTSKRAGRGRAPRSTGFYSTPPAARSLGIVGRDRSGDAAASRRAHRTAVGHEARHTVVPTAGMV